MVNFFSRLISNFISGVSGIAEKFLENFSALPYSSWQIALDILFVALLFYWLIMLIKGTRAINIILGLIVVAMVFALSTLLNLVALGWLLDRLLTVILVSIPIIFQQELRRGLEKLGKTKFFLAREAKEIDFLRSEIIEASFEMAKKNWGALIVFRGEVSLSEYMETGVSLNARLSKELLLSIFSHGSPLHDGALIVERNLAAAAGCVLPHSFKDYGHKFGTRHKAALGLSETTDAKILVVSEQRGTVSFVSEGEIKEDIAPEQLQEILTQILEPKKKKRR